MINNRQAGRRNRGRNNGRQNGGNRGGDNGNRVDSRARGNAPQLLEKYRNLARDAQLAGDRVNTEYYLQFADHYFRVIADNRARQEEHQARFRRNDDALDDYADQDDAAAEGAEVGSERGEERHQSRDGRLGRSRAAVSAPVYDDADDAERAEEEEAALRRRPRKVEKITIPRRSSEDLAVNATSSVATGDDAAAEPAPPRRAARGRKPRQLDVPGNDGEEASGLDLAALPPAIVRADNDSDYGNDDESRKSAPPRRGRRPKASAEAAE